MAKGPVVISNGSGGTSGGEAVDIARYSNAVRITIGTSFIIGGLLGGTMCIIIPVVHLFTTWGLPLLGILLGLRTFKRRAVVYNVTATCPTCQQPVEFNGGSVDDPSWQICPKCSAKLTIRPTE